MTDPNKLVAALVLDQSGSMYGNEEATITAVNQFMAEQQAVDGEAEMMVVFFNHEHAIPPLTDLKAWKPLTRADYKPDGNTAMLAAVSHTIDEIGRILALRSEDARPGLVVIGVMTDGMENPAQPAEVWNALREKIKHQTEQYGWKFIFLGANINTERTAFAMGIPKNMTMSYDSTPVGTSNAIAAMSGRMTSYRTGGRMGNADAQAVDHTAKIK